MKRKDYNERNFLILIAVIVLVAGFLIAAPFYQKFVNSFEYAGIKFEKIKYDSVYFYHGVFPIIYKGNLSAYYNFYLRVDPRKNDIPINATFVLSKEVYIGLENKSLGCNETVLGQYLFGQFFRAFPWVTNVTTGLTDSVSAKENNVSFVSCALANENRTVILTHSSENASIEKVGDNCFKIDFEGCKYISASERYVIGVAAQINGIKI